MDTSAEAAAVQARIHRSLSGSQRLLIALQMSETVRELAFSRLRMEHPECEESDIRRMFLRSQFGVPV